MTTEEVLLFMHDWVWTCFPKKISKMECKLTGEMQRPELEDHQVWIVNFSSMFNHQKTLYENPDLLDE